MLRSRTSRLLLGLLAVALLAGGALVWWHKTSPYHFRVVTPGVLYRSGFLHRENLRHVIEKYGIRTVVNLSTAREKDKGDWDPEGEIEVCREEGVRLIQMPIEDETPPSADQLAAWLALLDEAKSQPILVHCDHGVVRTGMLVAVYEMERLGKTNQQAFDDLPRFGHTFYKPGREHVRAFVLGYVPRSRG